MKNSMIAALVAVFLCLSITGCTVFESINNNPETADVVIKIAVSQYIDAERDPAQRVIRATVGPNDIILVAGKGHETYQDVAGVKSEFNDSVITQEFLIQLNK